MKQVAIAIGIVLLAFHSAHAAEKEFSLMVNSSEEAISAYVAWDKLFYSVKGVKMRPIELTEVQIEKITKLCSNVKKAVGDPNPRAIPKNYPKGVMSFSLTLPGSEKAFATLLLKDEKKGWVEAIKLREYLDSIGSKGKALKK